MTIPRRTIFFLLLPILMTSPLQGDTPWPQFRGPDGNGQTEAKDLPLQWSETKNITWKTAIHGRGWSSPVVWAGQVWLTTATEDGTEMFAICIDGTTGKVLRDIKLFDVKKPDEIHATNSYASPTPVIDEENVFVHFGSYGTACLSSRTGQVVWKRRDLPCNHWRGPGSSPILFQDMLIVHLDGYDYQYVVALDKKTGATRWKVDRDIDFETDDGDFKKAFCTPTVISVDRQPQLISPAAKAAIAYDPRNGKELWRIRYDNHSATARPIFGHGLVYINSGFSRANLIAVRPTGRGDVTDSHVSWIVDRGIGSKPSSLLIGDLIYTVHDRGTALCLDARTGESVWQERVGKNFSAAPLFGDEKIYFMDETGTSTVLRPGRRPTVLATNRLDDGCMASPAVLGRALLVRTKTHLYRIESR